MPQKKRAMLVFAVLVAIAAVAVPSAAKAQQSCVTSAGWTVMLMGTYPSESTANCPGEGNWEYRYQVCKPGTVGINCKATGLLRTDLAIPDCSLDENKIELTKATGCTELLYTFPVGAGDPINKFELGDQFAYAARLPYWMSRTHERSFCANTGQLKETSICLDILLRPGLSCCKIAGPACGKITSETLSVVFGSDKWVFVRTTSITCYDTVYGCLAGDSDAACMLTTPIDPQPIQTLQYAGQSASVVAADGECIVWAQFGEGTIRCPIIGGVKYCK